MSEFTEATLYKGRVKLKLFTKSHQYWGSLDGGPSKRKSGVTTFIGIKDKSRPLGIWQQNVTADFLLSKIEEGVKIDVDLALEAAVQNEVQRDAAIDIGLEAHAWIEGYIKHKLKDPEHKDLPDIPKAPEAVTGVNSFLDWEKKHKVKFISSERLLYSIEHDYVGTMDFEAIIDGIYCNGNDFKTSNGIYNSVRMQSAAYEYADREERKCKKAKGRWVVRLSKYTEEEYMKRETRKREIKRAIARIKGNIYKEFPIEPYQVFEAKFLDEQKTDLDRDFKAFLNAKDLYQWDKETDFFLEKKKLK